MTTDVEVRAATARDYEALVRLWNAAYPLNKITSVALMLESAAADASARKLRVVAVQAGDIIGIGAVEHWTEFYEPHKFLLHLAVKPECRRRGIGNQIYQNLVARLADFTLPRLTVKTWIAEDNLEGVRFARRHGYEKDKLRWNIELDLRRPTPRDFSKHLARLQRRDIEINSVAETVTTLAARRALYDLYLRSIADISTPDYATPPDFDEYEANLNDELTAALSIVAVDRRTREYVGLWMLYPSLAGAINGDVWGVAPAYRHRGVALGIVLKAIDQARSFNYRFIKSHTDEHNRHTLSHAAAVGFTTLPAQLLFVKTFAPHQPADSLTTQSA